MRFVKTVENLFGLPQGFTRVEYLESTGTQYIDTGYIPKPTSSYKCEFELTNITTTSGALFCVFGSVESNNVIFTELYLPRASGSGGGNVNQVLAGNHNSTYVRKDYVWAINTPYDFEMTTTNVSINGVSQGSLSVDSSVTCSHSIYLFARHENNDAVRYNVKAKVRNFQVLENNTLVRDYIPCLDPLGVPCMYDLVDKKPYYNQGTGDFTAGRQIIPVEYLESTTNVTSSGPYIDTGIEALNTTSFMIDFSFKNTAYGQGMGEGYLAGKRFSVVGFYINGGSTYFGYAYNSWYDTDVAVDTNRHTFELDAYNKKYYLDNHTYNIPNVSYTSEGKTIGLFCRICNNNGTTYPNWFCAGKMYGARIKQNGILVRDFIPCKDENNVGFMFDALSGAVYLNAGTGAFSVGENKYKTKLRLIRDNKLPAGYTQVEYLESTGTQYIDSGYTFNEKTTINFKSSLIYQNSGYPAIYGARITSNVKDYQIYYNDGNVGGSPTQIKFRNGYSTYTISSSDIGYSGDLLGKEITVKTTLSDITVTGLSSKTISVTYGTNVSPPVSTVLFAQRGNGTSLVTNFGSFKIYYFKIYDNGVLVRDYIPALDPAGTPCMYDMVTKAPFYNQGTGTFITGKPVLPMVRFIKDIVPREYAIVNYIESTGTQYIDTGFIPTNSTETETTLNILNRLSANYPAPIYCGDTYNASNTYGFSYNVGANCFIAYRGSKSNIQLAKPQITTNKLYKVSLSTTTATCVDLSVSATYTADIEGTYTTGSRSLYLFRGNSNTTDLTGIANMRIYSCKIWDNNTIVRNFIPVVRRIDKVAGMWDTVTKQFFTTPVGAFNYG